MNCLYRLAGLLVFVSPGFAGDVQGHTILSKRLAKRTLSPVVYNLRGVMPQPGSNGETGSSGEYTQLAIVLEGSNQPPKAPETVVIDQRNIRFDPDLVIVPVGSTVQFPNSDPIFHNIFSLSKTQPFDLGFYPQHQTKIVKFNRAGIVQVYCHIHANMYAAIVVTASPWFARAAADGSFSFSGVPAGRYKLVAWHKVAGFFRTEVDVPESGKVDAAIRIPIDVEPEH